MNVTVESLAGRYHHPSGAAPAGDPGPLPVLILIDSFEEA